MSRGAYESPKSSTPAPVDPAPSVIPCPFCKGEIDADARKCRHCGEWIKDATTAPMKGGPTPAAGCLIQLMGAPFLILGSLVTVLGFGNGSVPGGASGLLISARPTFRAESACNRRI